MPTGRFSPSIEVILPIRPENRARYPADWKAISLAARDRARWRCQHPGCRAMQYAVGHWQLRDVPRPPGTRLLHPLPPHLRRSEWVWVPAHGNGPCDAAGQGLRWSSLDRWSYAEARQFVHASEWASFYGDPKPVVIVLTVAHLDHRPENCEPDNLAAMCQRHHLAYDLLHHRQTAYATRRAASNTPDLFA